MCVNMGLSRCSYPLYHRHTLHDETLIVTNMKWAVVCIPICVIDTKTHMAHQCRIIPDPCLLYWLENCFTFPPPSPEQHSEDRGDGWQQASQPVSGHLIPTSWAVTVSTKCHVLYASIVPCLLVLTLPSLHQFCFTFIITLSSFVRTDMNYEHWV